jgi:DNA polymerase I-like protein with 3'-5' exonuclease and polymerase domains
LAFPAKITELLNTPVQGTAADIPKKALGLLPRNWCILELRSLPAFMTKLSWKSQRKKQAATIPTNVMEAAGKRYLKQVPVLAESIIANNWVNK